MTGEAFLVPVRGNSDRALHVDEDCPELQRARDYSPVDPGQFPHLDECNRCSGEVDYHGDSDWGPYRALRDAAEGGAR